MKKNTLFSLLLIGILTLSLTGKAWGWGATGSDGGRFDALQETAVFFNNSGDTLDAGEVVILDTYQTGVATGTTLGSYVTLSGGQASAAADSVLAVGVVKSTSVADQRPVVVVTKGPISTLCDDSSDAVSVRTAVGTSGSSVTGRCGGGTNLGIALEAGDGTNGDGIVVWVDPTGAD